MITFQQETALGDFFFSFGCEIGCENEPHAGWLFVGTADVVVYTVRPAGGTTPGIGAPRRAL